MDSATPAMPSSPFEKLRFEFPRTIDEVATQQTRADGQMGRSVSGTLHELLFIERMHENGETIVFQGCAGDFGHVA